MTDDCRLVLTFNLRGGEAEEALKVLCETAYLYNQPDGSNPINGVIDEVLKIKNAKNN